MGCLFAILSGVAPRLAFLFFWIARPAQVDAAFDTFIFPLLGIIFLPFTTLLYVLLHDFGGLHGADWVWIILAVMLDLMHYAQGVANRPGRSTAVA
jgi:hypothetical protein